MPGPERLQAGVAWVCAGLQHLVNQFVNYGSSHPTRTFPARLPIAPRQRSPLLRWGETAARRLETLVLAAYVPTRDTPRGGCASVNEPHISKRLLPCQTTLSVGTVAVPLMCRAGEACALAFGQGADRSSPLPQTSATGRTGANTTPLRRRGGSIWAAIPYRHPVKRLFAPAGRSEGHVTGARGRNTVWCSAQVGCTASTHAEDRQTARRVADRAQPSGRPAGDAAVPSPSVGGRGTG